MSGAHSDLALFVSWKLFTATNDLAVGHLDRRQAKIQGRGEAAIALREFVRRQNQMLSLSCRSGQQEQRICMLWPIARPILFANLFHMFLQV